jgi:hypothetical protein
MFSVFLLAIIVCFFILYKITKLRLLISLRKGYYGMDLKQIKSIELMKWITEISIKQMVLPYKL